MASLTPSLVFPPGHFNSAAIFKTRIGDLFALYQRAPRSQALHFKKRIRVIHRALVRLACGYALRSDPAVIAFAPDGALAPDGLQWRYFQAATDHVHVWSELQPIGAHLAPRAGVIELRERDYERLYPLMDPE